ncbi:MAG: sulfatase-like hydrolase/transferase [Planktotalea sp.]|uniref:sulfatase family protein n=1 Tax=Planktotalea sp. TaxID=2029877 RepID=UPI003C775382
MEKQPNFLFFITDQHRADWLGCSGHPVVKTPNIDAIAADGTLFEDFHVALPVCMPNRASLMTGRMPSVHGLRHNGCLLSERANTFVDVLAAAGYATASIGKSHLQPFTDHPPLRKDDAAERLVSEAWKPDTGTYTKEEPACFAGDKVTPFNTPYYGFQHVDMVTGHGDQCGGQYGQWVRETIPDWQALYDPANELAHNYTCPQAYRTPVPEDKYPTAWIADRAIEYLEGRSGQDDPFFAFVSFPDPHHPFNPPGKYWDMYAPDQFDVDLPYAAHQNPPVPLQSARTMWEEGKSPPIPQMAFYAEDQHIREAKALSAGMITMIDDHIGRVVQALKDSGAYENTVIIFTSDHGDYLGDFNMLLKGPLVHSSITRVPMIWSDPDTRAGVRSGSIGSTIDLSASILDRAGLTPYVGMQGQSFLGALDGTEHHRDEILIEMNDGGPRMGFKTPARVRTLRTSDWRFSVYAGQDWGELYDLRADPRETHNLWHDPEYAQDKAALSMRLIEHLTYQMDESPRANRLA